MKPVDQPEDSWPQFLLGILHLHALAIASVAAYVHSRAVLHHFQRAGLIDMSSPADHDLTYEQALLEMRGDSRLK